MIQKANHAKKINHIKKANHAKKINHVKKANHAKRLNHAEQKILMDKTSDNVCRRSRQTK